MTLAATVLALVTAERLAELWLARRNTARLMAAGAYEVAPRHYILIVLLHAAWIAVLWGWGQQVNLIWLGVFCILQVGRVWVLATLGQRWTTRIIIVPGEVLVARGPYRFVSHPNYLIVVAEIAVLPLALGLPWVAVAFTLLNAAVLTVRIRAENAALQGARNDRFADV